MTFFLHKKDIKLLGEKRNSSLYKLPRRFNDFTNQ